MHLVDYSEISRKPISIQEAQLLQGPIMVFLGGLLHVQDIDTEGGFARYLSKLRGMASGHIIMPLDENCTDTAELNQFMYDYGHGEKDPSIFAQEIYKTLYAAAVDECDVQNKTDVQKLKSHLSRISLIGYSYGSSLVQQIAECMTNHLSERFGEDGFKGIKIFDICRSVKAINIGPVARYHHITSDGTLNLLHHGDPCFSEANTIFSQLSFMMKDDKIIQKSFGNELLGGKTDSESGIECRHTETTSLIIDYVGTPYHKAIGYQKVPDGTYFAKIISAYDFILHDLRTYMNIHEKQGNLVIFPTLAIAPVLRYASALMMEPGLDGKAWLEKSREQVTTDYKKNALVEGFSSLNSLYADTIKGFENREYWDAIEFLKDFVANRDVRDMPIPKPALRSAFPA